jgi:hypothetical protein
MNLTVVHINQIKSLILHDDQTKLYQFSQKMDNVRKWYLLTYLLTHSLTPWCRILFEKLIVTQLIKKKSRFLMEPEGSSLCSQKSATGPYPEPA